MQQWFLSYSLFITCARGIERKIIAALIQEIVKWKRQSIGPVYLTIMHGRVQSHKANNAELKI